MSGLATLGGIGQGLMQGSTFIQNKNMQDARLGMLEEEQGWKRSDRQAADQEQQRKAKFDQLYADTWNEFGVDADPLQVSSEVFKRSVATGQAKREELEPLLAGVRQMRQRGITNAIRMGDGEALANVFSQQFGRPVQVQTQMSKDALGHPMPMFSIVGEDGAVLQQLDALQVGSILGADDIIADEERKLERAKGLGALDVQRSQIGSNNASAAASYSQTNARRGDTAWEEELRDAQRAVAAGTATPQQTALLKQQARSGEGGRPPAELQTVDGLVERGIASSPTEAWEMLRRARDNPTAEATRIFNVLRADPRNRAQSNDELMAESRRLIGGDGGAAPAAGGAPGGEDFSTLWR